MTSNALSVLVEREIEVSQRASKGRQSVCATLKIVWKSDKYAHAAMLLAVVTVKRHKKRTVWVRRWSLDR